MHHYPRKMPYRQRCRNADRAWWVASFALIATLSLVLLLRYHFLDFGSAYPAFIAILLVAATAILFALAAFVRIWREDDRGVGTALLGFFCALMILLAPLSVRGYLLLWPGSNDISSNYRMLPPFSRTGAAFAARGNTIPETPSMAALTRQAAANPDITSLAVDGEPEQLLQQVQEIARDNGWSVIAVVAPGRRSGDGHVDMVLHTPVLRLPVDMTVRIRPMAGGARVDIRCVSRYRDFDFANNADVVRGLLAELLQGLPLG